MCFGAALAGTCAGGAIAQATALAQTPPERSIQGTMAQNALPSQTAVMQQFNQRFPSDVVIPTYISLTEQTALLVEASQQFAATPTEQTLERLRTAWVEATTTWARGQSFAFGPIHSLGYSTALEFPVDAGSLNVLLNDPTLLRTGNLDAIVKAIELSPSVHGFEAIAYILYGTEGNKPLDAFSAVERLYLTRIAAMADQNARELLQVWQEGWEGYAPYETVLATAGEPGNGAYLSVEAGTEEVIRGLCNRLDVVVNEELPEMLAAWELDSILPDAIVLKHIHSSIASIQMAYAGSPGEATTPEPGSGLSQLVAMEDRVIDRYIHQSLDQALVNLEEAIANPENHDALTQAHEALVTVHDHLETDVLALVQRPQ